MEANATSVSKQLSQGTSTKNLYEEICSKLSKEELELCLDMKTAAHYEEEINKLGEGLPPSVYWKNTAALERYNFMNSFVARINASDAGILIYTLTVYIYASLVMCATAQVEGSQCLVDTNLYLRPHYGVQC